MPVGLMINQGIMPVVRKDEGVADDAESVAAFFSKTCAARVADNGPMSTADGKGQKWEKMCSACSVSGVVCMGGTVGQDVLCLLSESGRRLCCGALAVRCDDCSEGSVPATNGQTNFADRCAHLARLAMWPSLSKSVYH